MSDIAGWSGTCLTRDNRISVVLNEHDYEFYVRASEGHDSTKLLSIIQALCLIGYVVLSPDEHPEEVMSDGSVRLWLTPIEDYADPVVMSLMAVAA